MLSCALYSSAWAAFKAGEDLGFFTFSPTSVKNSDGLFFIFNVDDKVKDDLWLGRNFAANCGSVWSGWNQGGDFTGTLTCIYLATNPAKCPNVDDPDIIAIDGNWNSPPSNSAFYKFMANCRGDSNVCIKNTKHDFTKYCNIENFSKLAVKKAITCSSPTACITHALKPGYSILKCKQGSKWDTGSFSLATPFKDNYGMHGWFNWCN